MELSGVHICLEVEDYVRAMKFWGPLCAASGFSPLWGDGKGFAGFKHGSMMLIIGQQQPRRVVRGAPTGKEFVVTDHVGFHVTLREDLDALVDAMAAAGFEPLFPAAEYPEFGAGFHAVTFCDDDNNVIEFAWRAPRE